MGFAEGGRRWVDNRFRSAFVLVDAPFGPVGIAARAEAFDTRNRGAIWDGEYDETGWSAMIAAKREWGRFTGLVELLHVSSKREDRDVVGLSRASARRSCRLEVRMHW